MTLGADTGPGHRDGPAARRWSAGDGAEPAQPSDGIFDADQDG